jgi:hypothetical protein
VARGPCGVALDARLALDATAGLQKGSLPVVCAGYANLRDRRGFITRAGRAVPRHQRDGAEGLRTSSTNSPAPQGRRSGIVLRVVHPFLRSQEGDPSLARKVGSTRPLPGTSHAMGRNLRQRFSRDSAVLEAIGFATRCHRLQPRGSQRLHHPSSDKATTLDRSWWRRLITAMTSACAGRRPTRSASGVRGARLCGLAASATNNVDAIVSLALAGGTVSVWNAA